MLQDLEEYSVMHCHSTMSNDTYFDSTVNFEGYLKVAKERNIKTISFTEHGNVMQWIQKKEKADKYGIKYVHGCEFYMAFDLNKKERQAFHILLYAKNYEGVKELNKLSSRSFDGLGQKWYEGIQYYYRPRISFEQLKNTSDNIIVSTACLASPLWRLKDTDEYTAYIEWLEENKHRTFLEVQPHAKLEDQKVYNKMLLNESRKRGIRIIAGTDTHVLDNSDNRLREVLQSGKKVAFNEEESQFSLHLRTLDELVQEFKEQDILSEEEIETAIQNTNVLSDMCEEWEIDKSHKYPKISKDPAGELWSRIEKGTKQRGVYSFESEKRKKYLDAIKFEYDTYVQLGMCDYMILLADIIDFCIENDIATAPRGSCNGSQSLWAMGVTDIDPIKYGTLFFRFVNPKRISLGDVDIDMAGANRPLVKDYLYNRKDLQSSAIVTYSKLALRGACRMVAKGLEIDLATADLVAKDIEEVKIEHEDETVEVISTFHNKDKWKKLYPEWIELTEKAVGIVQNTSVHACGFIAFDGDIDEEIGTFRNKNSKWVISQNDMKAVDSVNFVKMDFLTVDNVQIVSDTEKITGVKLINDEIDLEDDNVWDEMLKSGLGIFQFEKTGWFSLKKALENYPKFVRNNPKTTRYFIMLALNGVIRPSCASFREDFLQGKPNDNGHIAINEFFANMNQYCIFQEQIMLFLEKFCHYDGAQSDSIRRAISKKGGTDKFLPEIKSEFMKHFLQDYDTTVEEAEKAIDKFLLIIDNAKDYGFSINHSTPYTLIGFKNAYYRHYFPLEYITVQLNVNDGKIDKTRNIVEYMKRFTKISLKGIKFRKSQSKYAFHKEENSIYKGIGSIKGFGKNDGDELYALKDMQFDSFTDVLVAIKENTKVNQGKVTDLIKLDFFIEFGSSKKLVYVAKMFYTWYVKKTAKFFNKTSGETLELPFPEEIIARNSKKKTECQYSGVDYAGVVRECESHLENEEYTIKEKLGFQTECLGYVNYTDDTLDKRYIIVTGLDTKYSPRFEAYCLNNGKTETLKIQRVPKRRRSGIVYYEDRLIHEGDILYATRMERKSKNKKVGNTGTPADWQPTGDFDWWLRDYRVLEDL